MKSCRISHIRLGTNISNAMAPPTQNQRLATYRRASVSNTPSSTPASSNVIEYLVCMPSPANTPTAIHQRGSSSRSRRIVHHAISTHHSRSNEEYWNSVAQNKGSGDSATATAAKVCASRPPPRSRAMRPLAIITSTCASTENNRRPISDSPNIFRPRCSSAAVSGG